MMVSQSNMWQCQSMSQEWESMTQSACMDQSVQSEWMTSLQIVTNDLSSDNRSSDWDERNSQFTQKSRIQSNWMSRHGWNQNATEETNQGKSLWQE